MEAATQDTLAAEERPVESSDHRVAENGDSPRRPEDGGLGGDGLDAPEQQVRPVDTLREAVPLLRRPFTPEAIKFKVQNAFADKGCNIVAYIDARLVVERLNLIIGGEWQEEYEPLTSGLMLCRLTVGGVTHTDVGEGVNGNAKAIYSDAFKRVAVKFGVGVSVYAIPRAELWRSEHEPRFVKYREAKGKHIYTLTDEGEATLRKRYEKWLAGPGRNFGEPIDHGDVADSAGEAPVLPPDAEDPGTTNDLSDAPVPLTDAKADELRAQCRSAHAALLTLKGGPRKMTKAAFEQNLRQASVSHDELQALLEKIVGLGAATERA